MQKVVRGHTPNEASTTELVEQAATHVARLVRLEAERLRQEALATLVRARRIVALGVAAAVLAIIALGVGALALSAGIETLFQLPEWASLVVVFGLITLAVVALGVKLTRLWKHLL